MKKENNSRSLGFTWSEAVTKNEAVTKDDKNAATKSPSEEVNKKTSEEPQIIRLSETVSTNQYLSLLAEKENLLSGSIVISDYQTSGRGQIGNKWESERGKNLLFSILLRPNNMYANKSFLIAETAALSIKNTLDKYVSDITIKWPNDIFYKNSKIAGILIENIIYHETITSSITGIGININQTSFTSDAPNAVSLIQVTGCKYDLNKIFDTFRHEYKILSNSLLRLQFDIIHQEYLQSLYRKSGFYLFSDHEEDSFEAEITDVELSGHLILRRRNGQCKRYAFKEIVFKV